MNGSLVVTLMRLLLRARLRLMRWGVAVCAASLLCLGGAVFWLWLLPQERAATVPLAMSTQVVLPTGVASQVASQVTASDNLARFYEALGAQDQVGEQVRILFALAAQAGLQLRQGEYKVAYDPVGRVASYQILLPLKGAYPAIWQFSLAALRAIPFASLDEINFKRDQIADAEPEARVRLTLYLLPTTPGGHP